MNQRIPVEIQLLPHGEGLPLPRYMTDAAAGMDLMAALTAPLTLAPGQWLLIPTGLAIHLPEGYEGQVRPRSGLALKHGITVLNAPGTIDADYRGEVGVLLINLGHEPFPLQRGERIAQLVIAPVSRAVWQPRDGLTASTRGEGGFGHTGR